MPYRGRFAPSPTGPLHFGSLVAALASFLDARANGGGWLIRIEDLDPLRETRQAARQILASLEAHGLQGDGPVRYQSAHLDLYRKRLQQLERGGYAYACPCSRKELRAHGGIHPRQCRTKLAEALGQPCAMRFALEDRRWSWDDLLLGQQAATTRAEIDDFVLQRKEGYFAYQLAVVADDIEQRITHVVRGSDLLDSTPFQLALYERFAVPPPAFMHLPVIVDAAGKKLSKQTFAPALDLSQPALNLNAAFAALNHTLPPALAAGPPSVQLAWGESNWQRSRLPPALEIPAASVGR